MIPGIVAASTRHGGAASWASVVSQLNMEGPNGSTLFIDDRGKVWTPAGTAQITDALGYSAGLFTGAPSRISSPSHPDWAMGTGDFTIEAWVRPSSLSGDRTFLNIGLPSGVSFGITGGGRLFCGPNSVSYGAIGATTLAINTMQHVEASRAAGRMRLFLNGVLAASEIDTTNYVQGLATIAAGTSNGGSTFVGYFAGHIRALRVSKGAARHSTNASFTPPLPPFPAGTP